ncbi:MAG TPA: heme o synthase [Parvibaculum sp.]|uniref:heme o synthase n=1 Tax=Parvibaculum sp. TaxID=2024848 RepID=UPI002BF3D2F6|nr:heme o synthase [Parvibaculum sp.]HMM13266.1 heme o synthase [Parvibaculum sp.]
MPQIGMASPGDYFELLKPRVMSLVIFTALVGLVVAPGEINPVIAFTALLCIAIGAGASGALNMWYDADIDAKMARTINRPVPAGRITSREALGFGLTLSVGSVLMMALAVNYTAAFLLAFTIFFYAVIYTIGLKRRTPQNIVIGGAAGAFPPMIGWAAVTGTVSVPSVVLFLIIFMWTPPHFWALALFRSDDYEHAGVPMLPVVAGEAETRRQILIYSALLVPVTLAPGFLGFAGIFYTAFAAVLGALFLVFAFRVFRTRADTAEEKKTQDKAAKQLFAYSILYLFLVFSTLLVEQGFGLARPLELWG